MKYSPFPLARTSNKQQQTYINKLTADTAFMCRGEASNPGIWTGSEITFGQTCLSSLTPLYLSTLPETSPSFTLFVSFEPSTRNSWAGQCRAAVLILHTFSYYICSRFCAI